MARLCLLAALVHLASGQRALHWVIRVSDLEKTIKFTVDVLGMKVLRHEENDKPCPLTCNGVFDTPWSKTMVGYGPEDTSYALELTYNYGIDSYERGEGLQRFTIRVPAGTLAKAKTLGYEVDDAVVIGPDGYKYELLEQPASGASNEPFEMISLRAADPTALADWYVSNVPGLKVLAHHPAGVTIGFDGTAGTLFTIEAAKGGAAPQITQWEGRNALSLPAATIQKVYKKIKSESPELIIHDMQELEEKLGTLFIVILRDPAGYEICLVSSETFDPSVRAATNYVGPDWALRKELLTKVQGLRSLDEARRRMLERMQANMGGGDDEEDDDEEEEEDDDGSEEPTAKDEV